MRTRRGVAVVAVALAESDWRALLAALPQCEGCPSATELTLVLPGGSRHRVCSGCAAHRPGDLAEPLPQGRGVCAIESGLLAEVGL